MALHNENSHFLTALYRINYRKLFIVAYRIVHSQEEAEDLVHDTFCLAMLHQEVLLRHPLPEGWLMCTIKKLASNHLKRTERKLIVPLQENLSAPTPTETQRETLNELLPQSLSPQDKEILIWKIEEQMSYKELAWRLRISESGARSRVARAVARCRLLMKETDFLD